MTRSRDKDSAADPCGILTTVRFPAGESGQDGLFLMVVGPEGFRAIALPRKGVLQIGRSAQADIRINDSLASRDHCRLYVEGGMVEIEDLESANGTLLRNHALQPRVRVELALEDAVSVGATVLMLRSGDRLPRPVRVLPHGYFLARLDEECASSVRGRSPFALIRLDVEGGVSTSRCAGLLPLCLQPSDIIGAYGPQQYELLLPRTTPEAATTLAAELGVRLQQAGIAFRTGTAHHPIDGRSAAELLERACQAVRPGTVPPGPASDIILVDPAMQELHGLAKDVAKSNINVLIVGETGTGKEILAEVVHRASPRAQGNFLSLNCAALSENLVEAELFGYEKGAFTGATQAKPGLLETAPAGTVFLDEVGELSQPLQAKLLRVIETRTLIRVGGVTKRTVDVRFVSATNLNLAQAIECGEFRKDLFFRLNGITLAIPPLRERPVEIEPFGRRFAGEMARDLGRSAPEISADALTLLRSYAWPGNIRELRNVIHRAVLLCRSGPVITPDHLPRELMEATFSATRPTPAVPYGQTPLSDLSSTQPGYVLEPEEKRRILDVLEKTAGNQTAAARLLGMGRTAFVARLNQYGISRPRKR
ncbi:MAG TPA: sigma 54-interacting transcriptional regulator [Polyangia bacterium]|jgi:Transcriptional regulator containing PAS, AAA-type ATPase, and DNA-binding domains|nr:sigma 54-interacting transcriptional regulator [Polyangia bacterium]